MVMLITFGLNSDGGAHSAPAHTVEPTLPLLLAHPWLLSDGDVQRGDSGDPAPHLRSPAPRNHTQRRVIK